VTVGFSLKVYQLVLEGNKLEDVRESGLLDRFLSFRGSLSHALLQRPFYCGQFTNWCHYFFFLMCVTAILGLKVLMHALDHRSFERKKKYKDNHTSWFWRRPFAAVIAHGMSLNIFPILTF
jgi:hypothetical protein